jgi:hypothetical protein
MRVVKLQRENKKRILLYMPKTRAWSQNQARAQISNIRGNQYPEPLLRRKHPFLVHAAIQRPDLYFRAVSRSIGASIDIQQTAGSVGRT